MNFTTATTYFFIWLIPHFLVAQHDSLSKSAIVVHDDSVAIYLTDEFLQETIKERNMLSLDLMNVRLKLAELALSDTTQKSDIVSTEKVLKNKITKKSELIELLEFTTFWPYEKRIMAIQDFIHRNRSASQTNTGNDVAFIGQKKAAYISEIEFDKKRDLIYTPPKPQCVLKIENGKVATSTQLLFSSTDPQLEIHFQKRDFINGFASLSNTPEGVSVLNLTLAIASPKANSLFGVIKQRELVTITLIDGTEIRLRNQNRSDGYWDVATQFYLYQCIYPIGVSEERLLKKTEIDKITIRWSKIHTRYEVFDLDFFINHFYCLENE